MVKKSRRSRLLPEMTFSFSPSLLPIMRVTLDDRSAGRKAADKNAGDHAKSASGFEASFPITHSNKRSLPSDRLPDEARSSSRTNVAPRFNQTPAAGATFGLGRNNGVILSSLSNASSVRQNSKNGEDDNVSDDLGRSENSECYFKQGVPHCPFYPAWTEEQNNSDSWDDDAICFLTGRGLQVIPVSELRFTTGARLEAKRTDANPSSRRNESWPQKNAPETQKWPPKGPAEILRNKQTVEMQTKSHEQDLPPKQEENSKSADKAATCSHQFPEGSSSRDTVGSVQSSAQQCRGAQLRREAAQFENFKVRRRVCDSRCNYRWKLRPTETRKKQAGVAVRPLARKPDCLAQNPQAECSETLAAAKNFLSLMRDALRCLDSRSSQLEFYLSQARSSSADRLLPGQHVTGCPLVAYGQAPLSSSWKHHCNIGSTDCLVCQCLLAVQASVAALSRASAAAARCFAAPGGAPLDYLRIAPPSCGASVTKNGSESSALSAVERDRVGRYARRVKFAMLLVADTKCGREKSLQCSSAFGELLAFSSPA